MHRIILKCHRRSVAELFSGSLLPKRGKQNGSLFVKSFQTIAGSTDPVTFGYRRDTITNSLGLQVINALQLGHRSQASDILSDAGAAGHALNVEDIVYILEYCARLPDPLFVMETWRVLEGNNIALSWKSYMLIVRALCNGGYLEEAFHLMTFIGENDRLSYILPLCNTFLSACAKMKDVMLFNQCLDLMESQSLGKNEVTYAALLKVAVWQKNLSAVHEIWREHCKHYKVNVLSLRKFIWSFTRLMDLESAYRTLQHMVVLVSKEDIFLRRTVQGKIYCPQLDIPIPSGSVADVMCFDLHKDQHASPASSDGEGMIMNSIEEVQCSPFYAEDNMDCSTGIEMLEDLKKGPIKKILRWSFNDVIHACGHCKEPELAQKLIAQMQNLGLEPSSHTYDGIAKSIIPTRRISDIMELLNVMEGKNLKPYASTLSTLSICCSNALHLDLAESLLNQIEASPCARPYNAFFEACDIMDQPERAVKMLAKMREAKTKPDIRTYELLFSLFGNINSLYEKGNLLSHADVTKRINAIETDMLQNGIQHSQVSIKNLLRALGAEGMVQELLKYLYRASQFSHNNYLGTDIYNTVLHSLVKAKEDRKAIEMFRSMKLCGIHPDDVTYTIMIDCCTNIRCFKSACALVSIMIRKGFPPQTITYTVLIKMLMEYDAFNDALDLLDQTIKEGNKPNILLFNPILHKASLRGRIDVIETVIEAMHREKIKPDQSTCNYVFNAYAKGEFVGTAIEALQVLSLRMISLDDDILEDMRRKYEYLIVAEEEDADTQIIQLFLIGDSENLAAALLNLRWCSFLGSSVSWVPDESPWAKRLADIL
ncbi:pentatricopeptide repeat-containing protein At1g76280 [Spinacia oleracea]|uniref:Pentatricopeptide repeat-containing protein At1g76280 n=1 Tax=Spinacia oleracea TaxID=3562 RepID=A0A9R0JR46_SPIOL|nr:pentatricopeptide repeat-containing protein At1g76280 [Spinacia oleracea]XP_021843879.2 pentatricopeptide repeat-containing protein At1g76280 [Spinacia oleracea]XP_021843880.2 pentatricopeptide repeat-containing protein At1g76280 [Spinacia oleracea]